MPRDAPGAADRHSAHPSMARRARPETHAHRRVKSLNEAPVVQFLALRGVRHLSGISFVGVTFEQEEEEEEERSLIIA